MNWDDIKKFKHGGTSSNSPFVSITKTGVLNINRAFLEKYQDKIKGKTHVEVYHSQANQAIVLKFISGETNFSRKVSKKEFQVAISIKFLISSLDLDIKEVTGRYSAEFEKIPELDECLVIKLNQKM